MGNGVISCTLVPDRYNGDLERYLAERRKYQKQYRLRNLERIKAIRSGEMLPTRRCRAKKRRMD